MVEGIWFKSVDIFDLVCVKWKILLMKRSIFCFFILWKYLVIVRLVSVICICVFGGLFIWLKIIVVFLIMLDFFIF